MSHQHRLPASRSVFRDDEPVVQSQPLLPGAVSPRFGDTDMWDFNGVVERPANLYPGNWRFRFGVTSPERNLAAREMAMIWFNPRHPAVLARGIHLPPTPLRISTVRCRIGILRSLWEFADLLGLDGFPNWSDEDFHSYRAWRTSRGEPTGATASTNPSTEYITVIKQLHTCRAVLADGGPRTDPWPGMSARQVLAPTGDPGELSTAAVAPETWFPLLRAAWTYIDVFSADILAAKARWQQIRDSARTATIPEGDALLHAWLTDPSTRVPLRASTAWSRGNPINWRLVTWLIGVDPISEPCNLFSPATGAGRRRRQLVADAAARGRTQAGLLPGMTEVDKPDGTRGPWHPGLQPRELWLERTALRNACFALAIALSMMRDNEIRAVLKDSVVEYFSNPAVKSTKRKLDPDLPTKHWWIIGPVAKAIDIASQLSLHDELAFAAVNEGEAGAVFDSQVAIKSFITHVNKYRHHSGLAEIPVIGDVKPHMFRRTMAMLTRDFPGSEIAVGMQLKHVATRALANRSTPGYMAKDPAWAKHLDDAIAERRFNRLKDLFDADSRGETLGYGPGADRMRETFQAVRRQAEELCSTGQAQRGDTRVEYDLLRRARFPIRFGKLNHCTMDDNNPVGAKCIEDAVVPEGHKGPLPDRCRPSRCNNSFITIEQIPIWKAEHGSLTRLRALPNLPPPRRALIDEEIRDVEIVLRKAGES